MDLRITLTPGEIMLARIMATFRTGTNALAKNKSPIFSKNLWENEILGVCGEIAFGKIFNFYFDPTFEPRRGGVDFFNRKGKSIDVKTTNQKEGRLIVPKWKNKPGKRADVYVLITGDIPDFFVRGWASADEVFSSVIDLGHGECFGLQIDQLHNFAMKRK